MVILADSWRGVHNFEGSDGSSKDFTTWQTDLTKMLAALKPNTGHMVVLCEPPGAGNLATCLTRQSRPSDCELPVDPNYTAVMAAEKAAAQAEDAKFVVPTPWFCDQEQKCPVIIDSTPVYYDGEHITEAYWKYLGGELEQALLG